ncbi:histone deacetylase [Desulfocarbo indianensis]|nr:histone deacetylase [Desulfocarbo indianensis]
MFKLRRVYDDLRPIDREAVGQVQAILRAQFPQAPAKDVSGLPRRLRDPLADRFRWVLIVAEDQRAAVRGFALMAHAPDLNFCYLDYISTASPLTGGGIGGALYERTREEAFRLGVLGLFMECLPDDPALCADPAVLKQNRARLRFYERWGARPVQGTAYETPVDPADPDCPPYLVYDGLGAKELKRADAKKVVRAILERKYSRLCPPGYVDMVVKSFRDDPVRLRPPRYAKAESQAKPRQISRDRRIALVINQRHQMHHVHERGYVEAPVRMRAISREIGKLGIFEELKPRRASLALIKAVHDHRFVDYLQKVCARIEPGKSVYPYVFPLRNGARPPKDLPVRAGYYCIDTFTPLNSNAFEAARGAVDCALTAAEALAQGFRLAYALVRPPGHHAERKAFGGFCYFNSAAVAAHYLSAQGPVAVIDLDYHHGNGTQDIFYQRSDVLTCSIHGRPSFAYPYFSGFREETGEGEGKGCNLNLPQPEELDGKGYRRALGEVLARVRRFKPLHVVVALGLDPAKGDPTGSWSLDFKDFEDNGRMVGSLGVPTLVVQEGGYRIKSLGLNARHFFLGLWQGAGLAGK